MNEMLQAYMLDNFNYKLDQYVSYEKEYKRSIFIVIGWSVVLTLLLFYVIDAIAGLGIMNIGYVILAIVLFGFMPMIFKKENKYSAIVVTPEFLIQRFAKDEFTAIPYENVTDFKVTKEGILIKGEENVITLGLHMTREQMDSIIDILEAKGKTFDPEKEYMIRPVKIVIEDGIITLTDINVETDFDKLYKKIEPDYIMLTPGFLSSVMFRNSNITGCEQMNENTVKLTFDRLEIKEGHPENTTFDSIIAINCVVIFYHVQVKHLIMQNIHEEDVKDEKLNNSLDELPSVLEHAVISDWKTGNKEIDFFIASGVNKLKMGLKFDRVLVGWNKTKE